MSAADHLATLSPGANVWIIGMGKTGLSMAHFCKQKNWLVHVVDSREHPPLKRNWETMSQICIHEDIDAIPQHATVFMSSSLSPQHPWMLRLQALNCRFITELDLFAEYNNRPVLAVTGTNGKTTTCHMLHQILTQCGVKSCMIGNSGTPLLDGLNNLPEVWVMELSSYQCHWLTQRIASVAVVLNIEPDHLDWHGSMAHYTAAKKHLLNHTKSSLMWAKSHVLKSTKSSYALTDDGFGVLRDGVHLTQWTHPLWQHDQLNALAAIAMIDDLGIRLPQSLDASHWCLPHRCQVIKASSGRWWVNDSKATNVASAIQALKQFSALNRPITWFVGGVFKEDAFPWPLDVYPNKVICFGKDAEKLARMLPHEPTQIHDTLAKALRRIPLYSPNDIMLLSPACASFDEFVSFEHRGRFFLDCVSSYEC